MGKGKRGEGGGLREGGRKKVSLWMKFSTYQTIPNSSS